MARHWNCPGGHAGTEKLFMPICPACGLPVQFQEVEDEAPSANNTLVKDSVESVVRDLVFLDSAGAEQRRAQAAPLAAADSLDDTLQRPSSSLLPPPPSADDTLQKPDESRPPAPSTDGPDDDHASPPTLAPGDTMVRPSAAPTGTAPAGGASGDMVHGYELLEVLGRGGMGVVYKARQLGLNRLVALKMILHGSHASAEDLARFRIEGEAVARLKHPNIVQVFDTGVRDGRPFFSLEYLEGGSLQRRLDGTPLAPGTAAGLIETLARAMDHAHRQGIVHRDLKPANVLIVEPLETPLAACTLKITDFGLAKRIQGDEQGHTASEAVLGTPTYMAPEQASGKTREVGPACDVYALGAILYDLLTGRPPFRGTTVLDTLQMVQLAEPVPPVRLQPGIPADLQTICLKCLEKDPARRYSSVAALADDLRRFQEGRPILARPVGTIERAWKWTRRRPAAAAALALLILLPLAVAGVSLGFSAKLARTNRVLDDSNRQLTEAHDELKTKNEELERTQGTLRNRNNQLNETNIRLEKTNQALDESEKTVRKALAEAKRERDDAEESFLHAQKAFDNLVLLAQKGLRDAPGAEGLRRALFEDAVRMCRHFTDKPTANPASRLRAARAYRMAADLQEKLGDHDKARDNYRSSLGLYDALAREFPRDKHYLSEALEPAIHLWKLLEGTDAAQAEKMLAEVKNRLARLPDPTSGSSRLRRTRAVLLANQATHHVNRGHLTEAEADYAQAAKQLAALEATPGALDEVPDVPLELARVEINRASLWWAGAPGRSEQDRQADLKRDAAACDRAVRTLNRLLKSSPGDTAAGVELGRAFSTLAVVEVGRNNLVAAARVYDRAVEAFDRLSKAYPAVVDYRQLLAVALSNQGQQLLREELYERAARPLARGRKLLEDLVGRFPSVPAYRQDLARVCAGQGLLRLALGRAAQAQEPLETAARALEQEVKTFPDRENLRRDLLGVYHNLVACHDHQARAAADREDWMAAEAHVRNLVDLRTRRIEQLSALPRKTPLARVERFLELVLARGEMVGTLRAHGNVLEKLGDHRNAAATVEQVRKLVAPTWEGWVQSAALLCHCIRLAQNDRALQEPERSRVIEQYGQRALAILGELVGHVPDLAEELKAADFEPLRERPAFRERFRRLSDRLVRSP